MKCPDDVVPSHAGSSVLLRFAELAGSLLAECLGESGDQVGGAGFFDRRGRPVTNIVAKATCRQGG